MKKYYQVRINKKKKKKKKIIGFLLEASPCKGLPHLQMKISITSTNNLNDTSLWSQDQRGREEDCPPSKWGKKPAKQKKFENEQWPLVRKHVSRSVLELHFLAHKSIIVPLYFLFLFFPPSIFLLCPIHYYCHLM